MLAGVGVYRNEVLLSFRMGHEPPNSFQPLPARAGVYHLPYISPPSLLQPPQWDPPMCRQLALL